MVFLFKLALAPVLEALPALKPWHARNARLHFSYKHTSSEPSPDSKTDPYDAANGIVRVSGFGDQKLVCAEFVAAAADKETWLQRLGHFLRIGQ